MLYLAYESVAMRDWVIQGWCIFHSPYADKIARSTDDPELK